MTTGIRSEASRSVLSVDGVDLLAINADSSVELLGASVPTPTGNDLVPANRALGLGQTWQNMLGSRAAGATYTNATGKPIQISISGANDSTARYITVAGVNVGRFTPIASGSITSSITCIVPINASYSVTTGLIIDIWAELRA